jgi:hypothetical protein
LTQLVNNGKIKLQNHHLNVVEVLEAIGADFDYVIPDQDWLDKIGQLPKNLKSVKEYKE